MKIDLVYYQIENRKLSKKKYIYIINLNFRLEQLFDAFY